MELCEKCQGYGGIPLNTGFVAGGELPQETKTCDECNGSGSVLPLFFIEFTFRDYSKKYWFPLFIKAENIENANKLMVATKRGLEEKYTEVVNSKVIPQIKNLTSQIIQRKFQDKRQYKVSKLNIAVWCFTDIESNPNLSFNEHLEFIMDNLPLIPRDIAKLINEYQFPVRVLKSDFKSDFEEYLLIDVVSE